MGLACKFEIVIIGVAMERESMEFDVVVVGAGPAGLATAIRLKQQCDLAGKDFSICVLEKGAEVGAHIMSGAVMETRALDELIPDWQDRGAPLRTLAKKDSFLFLTRHKSYRLPTPPPMHNSGNYIVSLSDFVRWLGGHAEGMGIDIFAGFAASEILYHSDGSVKGVATGDRGVDKAGDRTDNFEAGMELHARYTVFAEGCRGHLGKQLIEKFDLRSDCDVQTYGLGMKELWEVPPEQSDPGSILHTIGWPLNSKTYGGSFLYHLDDNRVAVGFVVGLDYENPHLYPYMEFQRFKHHPAIASVLRGGKRIGYGARALNEGGFQSIPKLIFGGGLLVGCEAGFLNVPKIKGSHTAMKSGMVAAEALFEALQSDSPASELEAYPKKLRASWLWDELYRVRNIRPGFRWGLWGAMAYAALDTFLFRGRAPWTLKHHKPDNECLKHKDTMPAIDYPKPDGVLSFDRSSNVAFSNTNHEDNQPCHLTLADTTVPIVVNLSEYDAPEQRYCPAGVYEIVRDKDGARLQINAQNCVHCKTCDIKDPRQNINWVVPQGGEGPIYSGM